MSKVEQHQGFRMRGKNRKGRMTRNFGIEPRFSTAHHPQRQGQIEINNKWMETYLRMWKNWASVQVEMGTGKKELGSYLIRDLDWKV